MALPAKKPNILVLWGDDIGWWNISYNSRGQMGYRTPNIDGIGNEGVAFTDYYGQQSCTAGRAAFLCGQNPIRTCLTKVGMLGEDTYAQEERFYSFRRATHRKEPGYGRQISLIGLRG